MKTCSRCKITKNLSKFYKSKITKDGLRYICKECIKECSKDHYQDNKVKITKRHKEYNQNNKECIKEYSKEYYYDNKVKIAEYRKNNKVKIAKQYKEYRNSKTNYDIYAKQISYADPVKNIDGYLQTKCTYCGKWYFPLIQSIQNRVNALNGKSSGESTENRLYCSDKCKQACPIYRKQLYQVGHPKNFEDTSSREVQPELRQMVFKRDNYTCQKCNKHQDELDVPLHCHHVEGIKWEPLESADIDQCMTTCQNCHIKIHKQEDCKYVDMQCK